MHLSRWRFFLACLMLVVLPLQGIAATFRAGCHAGVTSAVTTQMQDHAQSHEGAHDHQASHAAGSSDTGKHAFSKASQCNACSPCCAGALVGQAVVLTLSDFGRPFDFFLPDTRHASPALAGLDRPPRYQAV